MRSVPPLALSRALVALGAVVLAGCSAITGNDEVRRERQLGVISLNAGFGVVVDVPATVARGADFQVTITTYGGGCIDQGDTEVTTLASDAEVRPFDIFVTHAPRNHVCTDDLRFYPHRATIRFAQAGIATVRFRGRSDPAGEVIVVERQVTVQ